MVAGFCKLSNMTDNHFSSTNKKKKKSDDFSNKNIFKKVAVKGVCSGFVCSGSVLECFETN